MYYTFTPIPVFLQLQVLSNLFFSSVADQYAAFLGARLRQATVYYWVLIHITHPFNDQQYILAFF